MPPGRRRRYLQLQGDEMADRTYVRKCLAKARALLQSHGAMIAVSVVGVCMSVALFTITHGAQRHDATDDFYRYAEERTAVLQRHLDIHMLALESLKGFFLGSERVENHEFHTFLRPLLKQEPEPGAWGWVRKVPIGQRRQYEQYVEEGRGEEFHAGRSASAWSEVYFPVQYVEVSGELTIPQGADFAASPAVAAAMRQSCDTGEMITAGPAALGDGDAGRSWTVLLLPIYAPNTDLLSIRDRRDSLRGFVFQAFALTEVIDHSIELLPPEGIDFVVHHHSSELDTELLAVHSSRTRDASMDLDVSQWTDARAEFSKEARLSMPGKDWWLLAKPTPTFLKARMDWHPWAILIGMLFTTGVIATYMMTVRTRRIRVESLAAELAESNKSLLKEVDDRRLTQEALQQQQESLQVIFDASPVGMVLLDESMTITKVNDVAAKLVNKNMPEMIDMPPGQALGCIHAQETPNGCGSGPTCPLCPIRDIFQRVFDTDLPIRGVEAQPALLIKGALVQPWLEINASPLIMAGGRYVIASISNITERKRAQEALQQAKADAEAANEAKTSFLANMSHEIRTPLTAILGFSEMLNDSSAGADEQDEWVDAISRNAEHLLLLISDVLDVSRIEADKLELYAAPCNVAVVISEVVSMIRPRAQHQGLGLAANYNAPLPETIIVDEAHLRQVLVNLLGNAIKFTDQGGITITATFLPDWRPDESGLQIDVADTGEGIAEAHLEHLFEPFYQADVSVSRRHGGTGLGLAISEQIISAMDGEITVTSTPGVGSVFSIIIPTGDLEGVAILARPAEALRQGEPAKPQPSAGQRLDGVRILLAEDGADNRRLIVALLERAGGSVVAVSNGRLAVQRAQEEDFDLVLMDVQMPEVDGLQATRMLRTLGHSIPIVALTAHALSGIRDECLAAGCTDYLTKPIDNKHLIGAVARYAGQAGPVGQPAPPADEPADEAGQDFLCQFAEQYDLTEVIGQFVHGLSKHIETMNEAFNAGALEELHRIAHQLKGSGGSCGYPKITELAGLIEQHAQAGDKEATRMTLAQLQTLCQGVAHAWQQRTTEGADL